MKIGEVLIVRKQIQMSGFTEPMDTVVAGSEHAPLLTVDGLPLIVRIHMCVCVRRVQYVLECTALPLPCYMMHTPPEPLYYMYLPHISHLSNYKWDIDLHQVNIYCLSNPDSFQRGSLSGHHNDSIMLGYVFSNQHDDLKTLEHNTCKSVLIFL